MLTVEDIEPKVAEYATGRNVPLSPAEARSIARQIHKAYKKYHDPTSYAGDFMLEFAGDRISHVFSAADNLNAKALIIYHYYFYNCVPDDWRKKLL